jgi:hypothetical protein
MGWKARGNCKECVKAENEKKAVAEAAEEKAAEAKAPTQFTVGKQKIYLIPREKKKKRAA